MATGRNWVFPVVGQNEWSQGSWMPSTKNHRGRTHAAIDIYAPRGANIVAPVGGTISGVGSGKLGGNWIRLNGDDGVTYYFAHMDSQSALKKGQRVDKANLLGYVGNSGSAKTTKTHVHFSMRDTHTNEAFSPVNYLNGAYVLDRPPAPGATSIEEEAVAQETATYNPDSYGYASAAQVSDAVLGGDDMPEPANGRQILGSTMAHVSDLIAGGTREDYRGLGMAGVSRGELQLQVKEVGQDTAVEEDEV